MAPNKKKVSQSDDLAPIFSKVLDDLKVAAENDDLPVLLRLINFVDGYLNTCDAKGTNLDQYREKTQKLHQDWAKTLKEGDSLELFSLREDKWYRAKILSLEGNNKAYLKYYGWGDKYNREVDFLTSKLAPVETFVILKPAPTKQKSTTEEDEEDDNEQTNAEVATTTEKPENPMLCVPIESSRRRTRNSNASSSQPPPPPLKKAEKKTAKKKDEDDEVTDHNDWICSVCRMIEAPKGTELVLCDGPCCRSFHLECLAKKPKAAQDVWICESCETFQHQCFLCKEVGRDYLDVFKCSTKYCGKYYHPACLEVEDATFLKPKIGEATITLEGEAARYYQERVQSHSMEDGEGIKQELSPSITINTVSFECPLHVCDTCFGHYRTKTFKGVDKTDSEITPCTYCPRAFHTNCIPPGSRFNSVCLVCPLHPYDPLPDKTSTVALSTSLKPTNPVNSTTNTTSSSLASTSSAEIINSIRLLYDQLTIPDFIPDKSDPFDNHFKLYHVIKEEIEATPKNFTMITQNNYSSFPAEKLPAKIIPETGCDCKVTCDDRCYNRLSHIECCDMQTLLKNDDSGSKKVCCLGVHCGNRAFTNREYAEGIVFREGNMGLGLKAANYVSQGSLVIEYVGEIIDETEMIRRLLHQREYTPSDKDYYVMELDHGIYVDGKHQGNVSRFINHSCNPNCVLERWNVKGKMRIGIFAKRDIQPGESFSYDYQFDTQEEDVFKCYCGASNCRGTMAPRKKERLLKNALASASKSELRTKLIEQAKQKKERMWEELQQEEWERSYTSKYLPGDHHHEIKSGPNKLSLTYGPVHRLFLKRNLLQSTLLLARKEKLMQRIGHKVTTRAARATAAATTAAATRRKSSSRSTEDSSTTTTSTPSATTASSRKRKATASSTKQSTADSTAEQAEEEEDNYFVPTTSGTMEVDPQDDAAAVDHEDKEEGGEDISTRKSRRGSKPNRNYLD